MKNVLLVCVAMLGFGVTNANAHERGSVYFSAPRPVVVVKSVSPCRLVGSFCRYGVGVGKRVFSGVGQIVTAPFKQPLVMPKPKAFIYVPSRWYYSPGRVMEVSPMIVPRSNLGTPTPVPPPND